MRDTSRGFFELGGGEGGVCLGRKMEWMDFMVL